MLVAKAHQPVLDIFLIDLATRASGKAPAVWSLIVAEFDDRDQGIGVAFEMARIAYNKRHQFLAAGWLVLCGG